MRPNRALEPTSQAATRSGAFWKPISARLSSRSISAARLSAKPLGRRSALPSRGTLFNQAMSSTVLITVDVSSIVATMKTTDHQEERMYYAV